MTREEIAAIDRECEEQHISQQDYLESHGIAKHQYYVNLTLNCIINPRFLL